MIFILFWFISIFNLESQQKIHLGDISLKLQNLKNKKGKILISLFKSKNGFPDNEKESFKYWVETPGNEIVLKKVEFGTYAVSLLHDEDGNYQMTYNFFRFPKEGFAFSNFEASFLKIPEFEECKFEHKAASTTVKLKIVY